MNEINQILADAIVDSISEEWKSASLIIKVFGHSVDKFLQYEGIDGAIKSTFLADRGKVSLPIFKLFNQMNDANPKHWNKMLFKIDSSGKFETEFEWDQALQDEYERNSRV